MALSQTISRAVETVFDAVDDLKEEVTLRYDKVTGFDHVNQVPIKGTPKLTRCEAVLLKRVVNREGLEEVIYMARYSDVPLEMYQTIETKFGTYNVVDFTPTQNFVIEIKATKGKVDE